MNNNTINFRNVLVLGHNNTLGARAQGEVDEGEPERFIPTCKAELSTNLQQGNGFENG